jgi:hypothetical protein
VRVEPARLGPSSPPPHRSQPAPPLPPPIPTPPHHQPVTTHPRQPSAPNRSSQVGDGRPRHQPQPFPHQPKPAAGQHTTITRWQAGRAEHPEYDDRGARPARQHDAEGVGRPGPWPTQENDTLTTPLRPNIGTDYQRTKVERRRTASTPTRLPHDDHPAATTPRWPLRAVHPGKSKRRRPTLPPIRRSQPPPECGRRAARRDPQRPTAPLESTPWRHPHADVEVTPHVDRPSVPGPSVLVSPMCRCLRGREPEGGARLSSPRADVSGPPGCGVRYVLHGSRER